MPRGVFAYKAAFVRADGIEVAQQHHRPLAVSLIHVLQHYLLEVLARAVGVGRSARAAGLVQRKALRSAVHRGRRRKDYLLAAVIAHRLEQHQRAAEVVVVVFYGLYAAFAYGFEARKVYHAVDVVFAEDPVERGAVAHVGVIELHLFAGDLFDALKALLAGVAQVVRDHHAVAAREQLDGGVTAYIAAPPVTSIFFKKTSFAARTRAACTTIIRYRARDVNSKPCQHSSIACHIYSTVTLFARLRGLSGSLPSMTAVR